MKIKKTDDVYDLERFLNVQTLYYKTALSEIKNGRKESCWMWYIFPQLKSLGYSENARCYGISGMDEAKAYLKNSILRERLIEISKALLELNCNNPEEIFGWPDDLKLKSCMTLFEMADPQCDVFKKVLEKYFQGMRDEKTLKILGGEK